MTPFLPVFTEKNNCQDCYKCIRECSVKAIKVEKGRASVISELCIFCGRCTEVCPAGAKKVRNDLWKAQKLVAVNSQVAVSIAPSYISEWSNISKEKLFTAIKMLGFTHISETAIGAEKVSQFSAKYIQESNKQLFLSSACPAVVEFVEKFHPELIENIIPIFSPLMAHAKMLKAELGKETPVVFIGPCIAKKRESDKYPHDVDVAITFSDLNNWFEQEQIILDEIDAEQNISLFPHEAGIAALYPLDGGMAKGMKKCGSIDDTTLMNFSGMQNVKEVLKDINKQNITNKLFLELLACPGGCINGPGSDSKYSSAVKNLKIIDETRGRQKQNDKKLHIEYSTIKCQYLPQDVNEQKYTEKQYKEALQIVGKLSEKDELNCGGCGYDSCREFAHAILEDRAERSMCASYMRKVAHDKATVLLQKIPSGVVIIDDNLKIIESNKSFAKILGEETLMIWDVNPGLGGANLTKLVSFHKFFASLLSSGSENIECDVKHNGKLLHMSLFSIQPHKIVGGIIRDLTMPEMRREEVIKRSKKVITENLNTVQRIAYLLGENASRTEAILNSIVESHSIDEHNSN